MSDQSRRKLLKSLATGSGAVVAGKSLPESWSRPVVDSVMLPAHAQTSAAQNRIYSESFTFTSLSPDSDSMLAGITTSFISQAHAQEGPVSRRACAKEVGTDVDVWIQSFNLYKGALTLTEYTGTLSALGTAGVLNWISHTPCFDPPVKETPIEASISDITDSQVTILIKHQVPVSYIIQHATICVGKDSPPTECPN